jgi:peptide/nickel transport system permease protein
MLAPQKSSRRRAFLRIARQKPIGALSGLICVLLVLVAIFASQIAPYGAAATKFPRLQAPSGVHPFGTDNLFRDMYSRIVIGSRISLGIGFGAVAIGTVMGTVLGLLSGYFRGWADLVVSRLMEVILGIPPLVFALFFLAIFKTKGGYSLESFFWVSVAIGIIITPTTARMGLVGPASATCNTSKQRRPWGTPHRGSCGATCCRTWWRRSS